MSNILTKFFKKFFHKFSEHESLKNYFSLAKGFHTNQNFFVNVKNETFQNLTIISQKMAWPSTDIIYELRHISGRLKKPLELKSVKKACPTVSEPSWAGRPRSNFLSTSSVRPRFVFFPSNCSRRNDVVVSLFVLAHSAVDGVSHGNLTFCKRQKTPNFRGWNGWIRWVNSKPH